MQNATVTEYTVVGEYDMKVLLKRVDQMLKEGWQPLGGIATAENALEGVYFQAMARFDP